MMQICLLSLEGKKFWKNTNMNGFTKTQKCFMTQI
ncbi:hypothetical protein QG37_05931 [Candidozyma auris]|uniref:Uncharacterized protein n=1 Tax=Candidozyma auris TaxID=498019 RepID=A0A0L0NU84_CANAR|nr:hypothetical protein QG37_05931 [[Candida] auris]